MLKKTKWMTLALLAGSATMFEGCLGAFWSGFWNTGWPKDNQWLNIALDVLKEDIFG